jgi:hypothetical protein
MKKKYLYASIFFTIISLITFGTGAKYGFTSEIFYVAKPITLFQYSTFLAFAFCLASFGEEMKRSQRQQIYLIIGFLVAMASFYEVFFNFFYWFSLYNFYGQGTSLDALKNLVPYNLLFNQTAVQLLRENGLYPVNLNFASKISVLILFCSLYWIYFVYTSKKRVAE